MKVKPPLASVSRERQRPHSRPNRHRVPKCVVHQGRLGALTLTKLTLSWSLSVVGQKQSQYVRCAKDTSRHILGTPRQRRRSRGCALRVDCAERGLSCMCRSTGLPSHATGEVNFKFTRQQHGTLATLRAPLGQCVRWCKSSTHCACVERVNKDEFDSNQLQRRLARGMSEFSIRTRCKFLAPSTPRYLPWLWPIGT